jgi:hypothetical protein
MTSRMHITLTARRAGNPDDLPDEQIYLVATSIDLKPCPPAVDVCVYGPKDGVCAAGMGNKTSRSWTDGRSELDIMRPSSPPGLWRPNGAREPLAWAQDTFFLIALMEHLPGSPSDVCSLVLQAVSDAMRMPAGLSRNDRVSTLISIMNRTIDSGNGGPNFCSAIELGLTSRDIWLIESKRHLHLNRPFIGYGGCYNIDITVWLEKHGFERAPMQDAPGFSEHPMPHSRYPATTHL